MGNWLSSATFATFGTRPVEVSQINRDSNSHKNLLHSPITASTYSTYVHVQVWPIALTVLYAKISLFSFPREIRKWKRLLHNRFNAEEGSGDRWKAFLFFCIGIKKSFLSPKTQKRRLDKSRYVNHYSSYSTSTCFFSILSCNKSSLANSHHNISWEGERERERKKEQEAKSIA